MEIKDNTFARQFETLVDGKLISIEYSFQEKKIFLTRINTFDGFNDDELINELLKNIMEILADKGNGNYAYIDNIQEANRFLGREFKGSLFAIAKDVKIQIEFNPKHVQAYRLIGYENRKLKAEDFKNDAVDAGELGSGHTVTALYEIIPVGVDSDFVPSDLKYTKVKTDIESQYNEELATIKFRYKKPDGEKSIEMIKTIADQAISLEQSSRDFKFSSAVAWFGLKLRDSKYLSEKSTDASNVWHNPV